MNILTEENILKKKNIHLIKYDGKKQLKKRIKEYTSKKNKR